MQSRWQLLTLIHIRRLIWFHGDEVAHEKQKEESPASRVVLLAALHILKGCFHVFCSTEPSLFPAVVPVSEDEQSAMAWNARNSAANFQGPWTRDKETKPCVSKLNSEQADSQPHFCWELLAIDIWLRLKHESRTIPASAWNFAMLQIAKLRGIALGSKACGFQLGKHFIFLSLT